MPTAAYSAQAMAAAQVAQQASQNLTAPQATVLAAVIGAGVALGTLLIKDILLEWWREGRAAERSGREVYRQYLAPLSDTCEKIVWRSSEIFLQKRHSFLKTATLPVEFNGYKRRSTLFRIATLIGWIRAMNLELAAIPRTKKAYTSPISENIVAFQRALADGPHVELQRLRQMCAIWKIDLSGQDSSSLGRLASRFEDELHAAVGSELRSDENALRALDRGEQVKIFKHLAQFLCQQLNQTLISPALVDGSLAQAIRGLSYREALIYRDWQDALGDTMLVSDSDSSRRYKTIGYGAFEALLAPPTTPWMKVFATSIDDIDFDEIDPNDFRSMQLKGIASAAASVLISIADSKHRDLVKSDTLREAKKLYELVRPAEPAA